MKRAVVKPRNAASVWIDSDNLYIELPSPNGDHPHTVKVTPDLLGAKRLLSILQARTHVSELGTVGDPTQWHLDRKALTPGPVRHVGRGYGKQSFTEDKHEVMRGILERRGLLK